uniref:LITAF domain-containing protein n=1 Tax=Meloidogyne enterolobii TaxID=390850 RepID=A0A6V7UA16_MELEN|nr:unnamed protein product [Meloidogyne enterolobii]
MDCPHCRQHILTETRKTPGKLPWIIMCICFVLGFFTFITMLFCWVPFCLDCCLDVEHLCNFKGVNRLIFVSL